MTLVYVMILLVGLIGIISFAVDLSRVLLAKSELQSAADAAARAAVSSLGNGTMSATNSAVTFAGHNSADGSSVVLISDTDVEFGTWDKDARTFTLLAGVATSSANAVRVTASRTAGKSNAIPLLFASFFGQDTCNAHASAIAMNDSAFAQGIIGLGSLTIDQGTLIDSYDASSGAYSAGSAQNSAVVQSNGNIKLNTGVSIKGNASPGVSGSVSGNGSVTGSTAPLTSPLNCPTPSAGSAATANDNSNISSTYLSGGNLTTNNGVNLTLPGGTYYFNSINLGATTTLTFTGAATVYVNGAIQIGQSSVVSGPSNKPANLMIYDVSSGAPAITVNQNSTVYANLYAPQCAIDINKQTFWCGSMVGSTLHINQQSLIHYDSAIPDNVPKGGVLLVK